MNDTETDATPKTHLGLRIAVAVVGFVLIAMIVMLGKVAMKQSATTEALATQDALREGARSAPIRE